MEYIADSFWKTNGWEIGSCEIVKQKVIVYSFVKVHGRENSKGNNWYLMKHGYKPDEYSKGVYLWEDGKFHYNMCDNDNRYHYFATQQEAKDCCVKYGYEPVDC